ncbi:SDR family NAD(P)-dependent oxidoreductase [candidate division GN15 bacterium]|nr:SDR family NAD(P)-dependent oxidoreductase [candidate division GN15 bacterium]
MQTAIIVGNSDGIGLGLTRRLLDCGWHVAGLSRRPSPIEHDHYRHSVLDVTAADYRTTLTGVIMNPPDLVVYCPGIGEAFDVTNMAADRQVFDVNLMGAVSTIEIALPRLVSRGRGHIIVLSSLADCLIAPEAPSYAASKAGLSSYVESVALAVKGKRVAVTNVRFGFVETKMAKGEKQPMKMSIERSVDHVMRCIEKRPIRYSRPRLMSLLTLVARWLRRLRT